MVQLVVFINLFFVPTLPLYKMNQKPLRISLDLLFQYCIITACNIPLTKVFIFLAKRVGGIFISIDSGYYTLAALASAFFIPALYEFFKTVHIEIEAKKNEEDEENEKAE